MKDQGYEMFMEISKLKDEINRLNELNKSLYDSLRVAVYSLRKVLLPYDSCGNFGGESYGHDKNLISELKRTYNA